MCDRFASFLTADALQSIFGTTGSIPNLRPPLNVAPARLAAVIRRHLETGRQASDRWLSVSSRSRADASN